MNDFIALPRNVNYINTPCRVTQRNHDRDSNGVCADCHDQLRIEPLFLHAPDCDFVIFDRYCDCRWPNLTNALQHFLTTSVILQTTWSQIIDDGNHPIVESGKYPFAESFDELEPKIREWWMAVRD